MSSRGLTLALILFVPLSSFYDLGSICLQKHSCRSFFSLEISQNLPRRPRRLGGVSVYVEMFSEMYMYLVSLRAIGRSRNTFKAILGDMICIYERKRALGWMGNRFANNSRGEENRFHWI